MRKFLPLCTLLISTTCLAAPNVQVTQAIAMLPKIQPHIGGTSSTEVYLTLTPTQANALLSASTSVATKTVLHKMQGDTMQSVNKLNLPAQQATTLNGPYHIMLEGLKMPLHSGQQIPLTLTFSTGTVQTVAIVR